MPIPTDASLTCNFTIVSTLNLGVSFQSGDSGANYGGQITLSTQGMSAPVTTQLWDNDGNVFFTIYSFDAPVSCMINSGSVPGGWTPYIEVATESGLTCTISPPQLTGENTYDFTLTVAQSSTGEVAQ